jgi:PAT family beta-lactamase induction signal transducer AmpG
MEGAKVAHPALFLVLFFPFGAASGYLSVTLAYLLTHHGVTVQEIATLTAISFVPQTWKFLWAPIVDTTLTRKSWYLIGALTTAGTTAATGFVQAGQRTLPLITLLVLASSLASTFVGMATEAFAAHAARAEQKGEVGGWIQAGNLGAYGLGGGGALWVAQHSGLEWLASLSLGVLCAACCLALYRVKDVPQRRTASRYLANLVDLGKDVWSVARSRTGYLAILILFIPVGTGAAQSLWAAVAGDWHASADTVALATGALSGVVSTIACVAGGYVCDAMDRKAAYALFGVLLALCAVGMALAPRTPAMFVIFTLVYAFVLGVCYSAFSAVTLEAIGRGAAATKYNLLASLSNFPIQYMTVVDGWAQARYGSGGMLYVEAAVGLAAVAFFGMVVVALNRFAPAEARAQIA